MRRFFLISLIMLLAQATDAQLTTPPEGGSMRATAGERIGLTDVTVNYSRPAVKGREGKIWGGLVYQGFQKLDYGTGNDCPWRAGANENTTIEFSTDVQIAGHTLPAGKYGFFVAYDPNSCTLIFSKNSGSWGSYFYDPKEDAMRVTVAPKPLKESVERLLYEFSDETDSSATLWLKWEKLAIPVPISTELVKLQTASLFRELRTDKGFNPRNLQQAADYLAGHDTRLDEALKLINVTVEWEPSFNAYMTRSRIQAKLHQQPQADSSVTEAMAIGSAVELHSYARGLLKDNKTQQAFDVFKLNYSRHPDTYTTNMGMARGYSALGKTKDALKYAAKAVPQAPDAENKKAAESAAETLKQGKQLSLM